MSWSQAEEEAVTVCLVQDVEALEAIVEPWRALARRALESNVFYEPGMLLEALHHLRGLAAWQVVLVHRDGVLIGLFPMQRARLGGGTRLVLELLHHPHSFLHTPLVHRDHAGAAVAAWLGWCRCDSGAALVLCPRVTVEGPFCRVLADALGRAGGDRLEIRRYQRPCLEPSGDADTYFRRIMNSEHRRRLKRSRVLLEEQGRVSVEQVAAGEDPEPWIDAFLALEAGGWKGANGTALSCHEDHARFFRGMVRALHRQGSAMLYGLRLDGRWVAMTCHFRAAAQGAFGFKPAFDEAFEKLSPGLLLEAELVRLLHDRVPDVGWVDSCSAPDGTLLRRLWEGRRVIGTFAMAVPGPRGRLALATMRLALRLRAAFRSLRTRPGRPKELSGEAATPEASTS